MREEVVQSLSNVDSQHSQDPPTSGFHLRRSRLQVHQRCGDVDYADVRPIVGIDVNVALLFRFSGNVILAGHERLSPDDEVLQAEHCDVEHVGRLVDQ